MMLFSFLETTTKQSQQNFEAFLAKEGYTNASNEKHVHTMPNDTHTHTHINNYDMSACQMSWRV